MKTQKKKNKQAVRRLLKELKDVLDAFGWYGIGDEAEHAPNYAKAPETAEPTPNKAGEKRNDEDTIAEAMRGDSQVDIQVNGTTQMSPLTIIQMMR
jgi:hypothetical protein